MEFARCSAWLQVRGSGDTHTPRGTSTANAPRRGDRPGRHITAARTRLRRGASPREGTYGTLRAPSRLCRGRSRRARATALPRSRLAAPPASFASRLAVLRKLAAEGCRPPLRGVLPGRRAATDPRARPAPPAASASRPLRRSRLQSGRAPSSGESRLPPPERAVGLCAARPRNARGKKFSPSKKGRGAQEGTPTPPSASEVGGKDQRTRRQIRRVQDAGKKKTQKKQNKGRAPGTEELLLVAVRASAPLAAG